MNGDHSSWVRSQQNLRRGCNYEVLVSRLLSTATAVTSTRVSDGNHERLPATTEVYVQTDLPRMALGVLVDREVADVHKLIGKARCSNTPDVGRCTHLAITTGARSQGIRSAGGQNVGRPVQPRGHVGAQEGIHPEVELSPSPKHRSRDISLTRYKTHHNEERMTLSGCRDPPFLVPICGVQRWERARRRNKDSCN